MQLNTLNMETEVPVEGAQSPIKASLKIESSERNIALIADKVFNERTVERQDNGDIRVHIAGFPYVDAENFYKNTGGGDVTEEFTEQGLDDRLDDLADSIEEALNFKAMVTSSVDQTGKRNLIVKLERKGEEILNFNASDIGDLADAVSTGLDDDEHKKGLEVQGAEVIAENGEQPVLGRRGFVTRFQATANGENDRLDAEVTNTLVQTKGGLFVISAADLNINAGINATLAIFIA